METAGEWDRSQISGEPETDEDSFQISAEEHLAIFNNVASEYLGIDGKEFARLWDEGHYYDKDDPWVMYVASLRPHDIAV